MKGEFTHVWQDEIEAWVRPKEHWAACVPVQGDLEQGADWVCERIATGRMPILLIAPNTEGLAAMWRELQSAMEQSRAHLHIPHVVRHVGFSMLLDAFPGARIIGQTVGTVREVLIGRTYPTAWVHNLWQWPSVDPFNELHHRLSGDLYVSEEVQNLESR